MDPTAIRVLVILLIVLLSGLGIGFLCAYIRFRSTAEKYCAMAELFEMDLNYYMRVCDIQRRNHEIARTAPPEALARLERLEKVKEAAKRVREVQHMCHVPRQINEGEALQELDKALCEAEEGGMSEKKLCPECGKHLEARGVCPDVAGCGFSENYGPLYKNESAEDAVKTGFVTPLQSALAPKGVESAAPNGETWSMNALNERIKSQITEAIGLPEGEDVLQAVLDHIDKLKARGKGGAS